MTSIIINSTDGYGKSAQKALTYVNPDATNTQLANLGKMVTATQQGHVYTGTYRVDKVNCDAQKKTSSITLLMSKVQNSQIESAGASGVKVATFQGTGLIALLPDDCYQMRLDGSDVYICMPDPGGEMERDLDAWFYIPETATQNSARARLIIQA